MVNLGVFQKNSHVLKRFWGARYCAETVENVQRLSAIWTILSRINLEPVPNALPLQHQVAISEALELIEISTTNLTALGTVACVAWNGLKHSEVFSKFEPFSQCLSLPESEHTMLFCKFTADEAWNFNPIKNLDQRSETYSDDNNETCAEMGLPNHFYFSFNFHDTQENVLNFEPMQALPQSGHIMLPCKIYCQPSSWPNKIKKLKNQKPRQRSETIMSNALK